MQDLGRTTTLDPLAEKFYNLSPQSFLNNNPLSFVDPTGMETVGADGLTTDQWVSSHGNTSKENAYRNSNIENESDRKNSNDDDYIFNEKGQYVRTEKRKGPHRLAIENSKTKYRNYYNFADPINDPKAINSKLIRNVQFVTKTKIMQMLENAGAFNSENGSFTNFMNKSFSNGSFDFAYSTLINEYENPASSLFIPEDDYYVHNFMNFGNFLWGAAGYTLGFNYMTLLNGAHAHNFWQSFEPDSDDDQYSITKGAFYSHENQFRLLLKKN
jgi:hypothetical protein